MLLPDYRAHYSSTAETILFLCYYDPANHSTLIEEIACTQAQSRFLITIFNVFEHQYNPDLLSFLALPPALNLDAFDALVVHSSIADHVDNLDSLDKFLKIKIANFNGVKVLIKKQLNVRCNEVAVHIDKPGYDLIFTCLAEQDLKTVYPEFCSGRIQVAKMFDAYLTPTLRESSAVGSKHQLDILNSINASNKRDHVAECTLDELNQLKKYWIEAFVETFDAHITSLLEKKLISKKPVYISDAPSTNVLLLAAHEPVKDPRLNWISKCAPSEIKIIQVGVSGAGDCVLVLPDATHTYPQEKWRNGVFYRYFNQVSHSFAGTVGLQELIYVEYLKGLSEFEFCEMLGVALQSERKTTFDWYLNYILNISTVLLAQSSAMVGVHAIIATDLPTLPAALILKALFGVPVIYDAHEYWPEADIDSDEYERQFWINMERRLVAQVDYCQTVSSGLATMMTEQYQKDFEVVPNCVPMGDIHSTDTQKNGADIQQCRFIFQGNFAPGRGLDLLISVWPDTDEQAILLLRGPDSSYKKELIVLAKKTKLLGTRIIFLPPVPENELVNALSEGDVGLIPYTPLGKNYENCCPNKLSQYMAARLPILANNTHFVTMIIEERAKAGVVTDFSQPALIIAAVYEFLRNPERRARMGENGYHYLINHFHWEIVSRPLYKALAVLTQKKQTSTLTIYPVSEFDGIYTDSLLDASRYKSIEIKLTAKKLSYLLWRKYIPVKIRSHLSFMVRKCMSKFKG